MKLIDNPEAAFRLARTIVSDIAVYNRKKILNGLKDDNIFDLLKDELAEGLELYNTKVEPELELNNNFFNRAIVDVLIKRNADVESKIW